jgi:hypothetical protein
VRVVVIAPLPRARAGPARGDRTTRACGAHARRATPRDGVGRALRRLDARGRPAADAGGPRRPAGCRDGGGEQEHGTEQERGDGAGGVGDGARHRGADGLARRERDEEHGGRGAGRGGSQVCRPRDEDAAQGGVRTTEQRGGEPREHGTVGGEREAERADRARDGGEPPRTAKPQHAHRVAADRTEHGGDPEQAPQHRRRARGQPAGRRQEVATERPDRRAADAREHGGERGPPQRPPVRAARGTGPSRARRGGPGRGAVDDGGDEQRRDGGPRPHGPPRVRRDERHRARDRHARPRPGVDDGLRTVGPRGRHARRDGDDERGRRGTGGTTGDEHADREHRGGRRERDEDAARRGEDRRDPQDDARAAARHEPAGQQRGRAVGGEAARGHEPGGARGEAELGCDRRELQAVPVPDDAVRHRDEARSPGDDTRGARP